MNLLKKNVPGLLLCLVIAVPSWFLGQALPVIGGPVFAILIGMILTLILTRKEIFAEGINYTSKKILQAAVVFLGFGMNLTEILAKGKQSLPIIISTITTSLVIAFILYKALKLRANNAVLVGVGSSICGGSAIAATAPVIGASDEEVAQSISVIFLFNVLAALIFPTLGGMLGLSNDEIRGTHFPPFRADILKVWEMCGRRFSPKAAGNMSAACRACLKKACPRDRSCTERTAAASFCWPIPQAAAYRFTRTSS